MKTYVYLILLFVLPLGAQNETLLLNDFLLEDELKEENALYQFNHHNFSELWLQTPNNAILGVLGEEYQRLRIKLLTIDQDRNNFSLYRVKGKSMVKGVVCNFTGTIEITEIREVKELHFGVDQEHADSGIKAQGILKANYVFKESGCGTASGIFKGELYTKWYLDKKDKMRYDDLQSVADGYLNNAFMGVWTDIKGKHEKLCRWGDYRVPMARPGFDMGAGEFSPSIDYFEVGWDDYNPSDRTIWWN